MMVAVDNLYTKSHFTIRISARRDHAIGKLNVERDLQEDIEHRWIPSEFKEGDNLVFHFEKFVL